MNAQEIQYLQDFLSQPKKIAIVPHRNPDGDALGSSLALYQLLSLQNHEVSVISPNEYPDFISWLPKATSVLIYEKNTTKCQETLSKADMIFALDFNALHRTGDEMGTFLASIKAPFVMIDHHQMPENFAKITVSDTTYGSTCELLYQWIQKLNFQKFINKDIATCIYTGIVTDSGSFKYVKTTAQTHRVVADLIEYGVDNTAVHISLFDNSSYSRLQILGKALSQLKILPQHKTAYTYLSHEDLNRYGFKKGETEGIVNYGLSIKGIDFAAIFIENKEEGIIKISFRSEGDFDVNNFARNHFNGGGHINAAGGKSFAPLQDTINTFEKTLKIIEKQ